MRIELRYDDTTRCRLRSNRDVFRGTSSNRNVFKSGGHIATPITGEKIELFSALSCERMTADVISAKRRRERDEDFEILVSDPAMCLNEEGERYRSAYTSSPTEMENHIQGFVIINRHYLAKLEMNIALHWNQGAKAVCFASNSSSEALFCATSRYHVSLELFVSFFAGQQNDVV